MKKTQVTAAWKQCIRCAHILNSLDVDLLEVGEEIPPAVLELPGMASRDFSEGGTWTTVCERCGTAYRMAVDTETIDLPGIVWEFSLRRQDQGQG